MSASPSRAGAAETGTGCWQPVPVTAQAIVTACALLLPIVLQLSAQATVLGARGREQRLASLRLLGLSSADVTLLALLETVLHTVVGALLAPCCP